MGENQEKKKHGCTAANRQKPLERPYMGEWKQNTFYSSAYLVLLYKGIFPKAAVMGMVPVISQHKITSFGHLINSIVMGQRFYKIILA